METYPRQPLLRAALEAMQWFSVVQIKDILAALGMVPSSIGKLKKDFVTALVNKVCNELSEEKRKEIITALAGEETKKQDQPTELLKAVSCLDAKDQEEYEPLVKSCYREIERQEAEKIAKMGPLKRQQMEEKKDEHDISKKHVKTAEEGPKEPPTVDPDPPVDPASSKTSVVNAMQEEAPLAKEKAPAAERKQRALGKARKATPECLKKFLPPGIAGLYINWMPENRMVMVDFQGVG